MNSEMIHWFAGEGYSCTVVTTFPYYPHWKVQPPYKNIWFKKEDLSCPTTNGNVKVYRCPLYVPANPTGKKRILQDFSFWTSMSWVIAYFMLKRRKHDLIIVVAPPFHLGYLGIGLKKWLGGKLVYHIQDLQIEAAQELNIITNKKLLNRIYRTEKSIMTKADYVSCISPGMIKKVKSKINRDIIYFPNWVDTKSFYPVKERGALKLRWGYKPDDIVFLYSGAIGEKQPLENILPAARELSEIERVKFIICGSGPYQDKLVSKAQARGITNVSFLPVQSKDVFNDFLNMADFHLILLKGSTSDLVMPSKLATILATGGVPIVTSTAGTSLHDLVTENNLGFVVEPDSPVALVKAVNDILTCCCVKQKSIVANEVMVCHRAEEEIVVENEIMTCDCVRRKSVNARKYAIAHLSIEKVMQDFLKSVSLSK